MGNLTMDNMAMSLAFKVSDITNENLYKAGYKSQILGKAPTDPSLHSYMAEKNACAASKIASDPLYRKEGKAFAMTGKLPLDCIDFNRARVQRDILNQALYKKSKDEVMKKFKGFQNMDVYDHPIVSRGHDLAIM